MPFFRKIVEVASFAPEKMKKNNLFTTDRMFCDVYCLEPGQAQASHTHADSDKVYFVLEGTPALQVGSERQNAPAGTAVLAPAGLPHSLENSAAERAVVLVFMAPKP